MKEKEKILKDLTKDISSRLVETKQLLEILEHACTGGVDVNALIVVIERMMEEAFQSCEKCRKLISTPE